MKYLSLEQLKSTFDTVEKRLEVYKLLEKQFNKNVKESSDLFLCNITDGILMDDFNIEALCNIRVAFPELHNNFPIGVKDNFIVWHTYEVDKRRDCINKTIKDCNKLIKNNHGKLNK